MGVESLRCCNGVVLPSLSSPCGRSKAFLCLRSPVLGKKVTRGLGGPHCPQKAGHHAAQSTPPEQTSFPSRPIPPRAPALATAATTDAPATSAPSTTAATPAATTAKPATKAKSTAKAKSDKPAATTDNKPAAAADAGPVQPGATKLPTILVTAPTRVSQPVDTTATTTTVLTQQALDDNKYANVPDAIMSVPGLAVVPSGNPGQVTSVFIHGLDSRQTLVTVDGRRQAVGLSGADDNFTNLTLDNIDQIEVVRTPVSSSQGGSAMGGVINLVTLSGKGLDPQGSVSEEAGSFNTFKESAQSRGQVGDFDYAVAASRQDSIYPALSPGFPAFFAPGFPGQADQYRNSSYRGNFGYQVTPDIYVDLHSAYSNAYTSSPGIYLFPDPTASLLIEDWNISPEVVAKVTDFYTTKLYYTRDQQRQATNDPFLANQLIGFGSSPQGAETRLQINTDSVDWQNNFQVAHNWSITAGIQGDNRNYYEYDNVLGHAHPRRPRQQHRRLRLQPVAAHRRPQRPQLRAHRFLLRVRRLDLMASKRVLSRRPHPDAPPRLRLVGLHSAVHSGSLRLQRRQPVLRPLPAQPQSPSRDRSRLGSRRRATLPRRPRHSERHLFP